MDPDSRRLRVIVSDGRGCPVRDGGLSRWLAAVAPARARGEVAVALVTDAHLQKLNRRYRRQDAPTDVLSFPSQARSAIRDSRSTSHEPQASGRGSHAAQRAPRTASTEPRTAGRALGDIVIAKGVARRQARQAGHPYGTELRVLALHGLLHLLGYDHHDRHDAGRMQRAESRLRRKGGLRAGLIERSRT